MEIIEGHTYPVKLRKQGESYYLLIDQRMQEYLNLENPDEDIIILKAERSKKYGTYFGFGKDKR